MGDFLRRVRFFFAGNRIDRELAEEMRIHLEMRAAEHRAAGETPAQAEAAARRQFGNATRLHEIGREAWAFTFLATLYKDVAYGARALRANPAFAATAVLSLALGIGANAAIFSIINAVMLRTLPVADPDALVQVTLGSSSDDEVNTPIWEQLRDRQQAFSGTLAFSGARFDLAGGGEAQPAEGLWVNGDFFRVLGVPALMGHSFSPAADRPGGGPEGAVAVISYRFWQRHFAGAPAAIGQTIHLDRAPFVIVGVTPPWFTGLDVDHPFDVAVPIGCLNLLNAHLAADPVHHWWLKIMGRIPEGRTVTQAADRLRANAPEILRATPSGGRSPQEQAEYLKTTFQLSPAALGFSRTRAQYKTALPVLMAIVALVLLIACATIANLLLARAAARRRELAVRMAIGAGRLRLIRQLMTESLLLAACGTAAGFLLAQWGSRVLVRMLSTAADPLAIDTSPDIRMLAFTIATGGLTALLFGLAPAIRSTRFGVNPALKEQQRGASRWYFGRMLVAVQVALSLVLLVGAGLFLGTLRNLLTVDTGFDRHNLLIVHATLLRSTPPQQRNRALGDLLDGLRATPGVLSAAANQLVPIQRAGWARPVQVEGYTPKSRADAVLFLNRVSPAYFATMRTPLLTGRDFGPHDDLAAARVVVINQEAARRFFGGANPLGRTIRLPEPATVIGVVKDTRYNRVNEAARAIAYLPFAQAAEPLGDMHYMLRTASAVESLVPSARAAAAAVDRGISLEFRNFDTQVKESLSQPRLVALLSTIFGLLAVLLAMVGLYGVTAYTVVRRRGEVGIRMALGAPRRSVVWLMLRDVAIVAAVGTAAGVAVALAAGKLVASLLYGMRPNDPVELAAASGVLAAAIAVAAYLPARRAARLDPMSALRED